MEKKELLFEVKDKLDELIEDTLTIDEEEWILGVCIDNLNTYKEIITN